MVTGEAQREGLIEPLDATQEHVLASVWSRCRIKFDRLTWTGQSDHTLDSLFQLTDLSILDVKELERWYV